jgi:two-component system sensor histidine kinase/response regulator
MERNFDPQNSVILVVDDSIQNLKLLGNMLKDWNYQIAMAKDGYEAIKLIPKVRPSLILLDIMMPDIDGYEVCERLKKSDESKDIPIIFLTAKTSNESIVKGFEVGGVDYVTKPFNKDELLMRIRTHLELKASHDKIHRQAEELEKINATKDKMFSVISHDLRAPLGGMKSMLDLIFEDKNQNREISDKALVSLKNAADHTYNLLENLLYWSRTQREKLEFEPEKLDISDLVIENVELLETMAGNKGLEIKNNVPDETYVFGDNNMLKTILRNLIFNAVKFTSEGYIAIYAEEEDNNLKLVVEDTGVGIKKEDIEKILNTKEYYTTYGTKREKGSGLGLNLCLDFIKRNNGELFIESEPGKGSQFSFTVPRQK